MNVMLALFSALVRWLRLFRIRALNSSLRAISQEYNRVLQQTNKVFACIGSQGLVAGDDVPNSA